MASCGSHPNSSTGRDWSWLLNVNSQGVCSPVVKDIDPQTIENNNKKKNNHNDNNKTNINNKRKTNNNDNKKKKKKSNNKQPDVYRRARMTVENR